MLRTRLRKIGTLRPDKAGMIPGDHFDNFEEKKVQ